MKVYVHQNCNSCKKALKWLETHGQDAEVINLTEHTPTLTEFQKMTEAYGGNLKKLFNTSGQVYRARGLKDQVSALSAEEVYSLLSDEGMLVKRPFLISDKAGLLGFKEELWSQTLLHKDESAG